MVAGGVNEKTGGATDRNDPLGRLRLLDKNAEVYREVIPLVNAAARDAVLLVVTDPPDPLAYLTRELAGHDRVLSTGTLLDSCVFGYIWGESSGSHQRPSKRRCSASMVPPRSFIGLVPASAGSPISDALMQSGHQREDDFRTTVENEVRYANVTIIEGIGASQYGIGMVCARIAEIVLRDERAVVPIGFHNSRFGVTLSLPGRRRPAGLPPGAEPSPVG
jgi:L-lactate dehydrogenase